MITWAAVTDDNRARVAHVEQSFKDKLRHFESELLRFNRRHNLISASAENFVYEHHIRHCLALNCFLFHDADTVVDWGSGGGLPALPLGITTPGINITAVDKVGKKMQAVSSMAKRLSVSNVDVFHGRADEWPGTATFSVSRATASLSELWRWHKKMLTNVRNDVRIADRGQILAKMGPNDGAFAKEILQENTFTDDVVEDRAVEDSYWPPGLICLKGGSLDAEVAVLVESDPMVRVTGYSVNEILAKPPGDSYFADKYLLLVQTTGDNGE